MLIQEKINTAIQKNNSLVCVGLDTDMTRIPERLRSDPTPLYSFNKEIIDATHDLVMAYKPNTAFYEAHGAVGIQQLKMTCDYINQVCPEVLIILDAKRGDIGNTNRGYARFAFDWLNCDILTVHPYFGYEACSVFLEREEKGVVFLCRSSNRGGGEFQDLIVQGESLYVHMTKQILQFWNKNRNCYILAGATYPEEMAELRAVSGDTLFLVPGIGAQGGDIKKTIQAGKNSYGAGLCINSSRGIIFASSGTDFAEKARKETQTLKDSINQYR